MQKLNRFKIQDLGFMNGMVIAALILTSYFLLPTTALAHGIEQEHVIRMTENGFEPKELTVNQGDEVLFINNDDVDRWPASNFHPTHTVYPEFDPLRSIPPGESWTFLFDKPGTWRMHDHLSPHITGTVVILEDGAQATTSPAVKPLGLWEKIKAFFLKLFSGSNASTVEFRKLNEQEKYAKLEEISAQEGPEKAWQLVLDTYNTPEGVVGNPHDMAHLVGQLLFKELGFEGLSTCTPVFAFGCYHGLMEIAFDKDRPEDYEKSLIEAQIGCQTVGTETSPTYWSCIHGMGHGTATFREHDLDKSLFDCDILPENLRTYCKDGVFMEFSISAPKSFYTQGNPVYPCNVVAENAKIACARSQTQVMRLRFGMDTKTIANACDKSGNKDIIFHCIDALGYFVAQTAQGDAAKIISGCKKIEEEKSAAQCMEAGAGELVFQNAVGWQAAVKKICGNLSENYRVSCEERVTRVKESYGRN